MKQALVQGDVWLHRLGFLLVGLALLVLAAAFGAMSWEHGTPLLWNVVVHEDGHRTLAQTIFYFEHATRELPLDLFLGAVVGAGAAEAMPAPSASNGRRRAVLGGLLVAVIILITAATALQLGLGSVRDNLLQYHTREGAPLVWGAHWRYHLLERGPLMLLALGFWGMVRAFRPDGYRQRARAALIGCCAFIAVTAFFTLDLRALTLPFIDPRYLGHEIREIVTHGLVTLPLCVGVILLYPSKKGCFLARPRDNLAGSILLIGVAAAFVAYALIAAVGAGSASAGQSDSLITLLAPHFFEHGFTYVVTPLTAVLVYETLASRSVGNVRSIALPSSVPNA